MAGRADASHVGIAENAGTRVGHEFPEVGGPAGETARESELAGGALGVAGLAGRSGRGRGEQVEVPVVAGTGASGGVEGAELGGVAVEAGGGRIGGAVEAGVVAGDAAVVEVVEADHAQALARRRVEGSGVGGPAASAVGRGGSVAGPAGDEAGLALGGRAVVVVPVVAGASASCECPLESGLTCTTVCLRTLAGLAEILAFTANKCPRMNVPWDAVALAGSDISEGSSETGTSETVVGSASSASSTSKVASDTGPPPIIIKSWQTGARTGIVVVPVISCIAGKAIRDTRRIATQASVGAAGTDVGDEVIIVV